MLTSHWLLPRWLNMQFIAQHDDDDDDDARTANNFHYGLCSALLACVSSSGCSRAKCVARQRKLAHLMRMDETLLPQRIRRGILAIPKIIPTVAA